MSYIYEDQVLWLPGQHLQEKIGAADPQIDRQGHGGYELYQRDDSGESTSIDRERYSALPPLQARQDALPGHAACIEHKLRFTREHTFFATSSGCAGAVRLFFRPMLTITENIHVKTDKYQVRMYLNHPLQSNSLISFLLSVEKILCKILTSVFQ